MPESANEETVVTTFMPVQYASKVVDLACRIMRRRITKHPPDSNPTRIIMRLCYLHLRLTPTSLQLPLNLQLSLLPLNIPSLNQTPHHALTLPLLMNTSPPIPSNQTIANQFGYSLTCSLDTQLPFHVLPRRQILITFILLTLSSTLPATF